MAEALATESQHGTGKRIVWFIFWNVLSVIAAFAIYYTVMYVESWDGAFQATFELFYKHETLAVLAATSPFLASLLVGWGYAQRARRRRAREASAAIVSESHE